MFHLVTHLGMENTTPTQWNPSILFGLGVCNEGAHAMVPATPPLVLDGVCSGEDIIGYFKSVTELLKSTQERLPNNEIRWFAGM